MREIAWHSSPYDRRVHERAMRALSCTSLWQYLYMDGTYRERFSSREHTYREEDAPDAYALKERADLYGEVALLSTG